MSLTSDIFRPYVLNGLPGVSGATDTTFKQWIDTEPQILDRYDDSNSKFHFYINNKEKLIRAVAFDVSRMSIASFESICSISTERELPRSTAWPLIRSYYAAFFSAHTIMRMLGYAVIQLERSQSTKLTTSLKYHASPPTEKISDGLHLIKISKSDPTFSLQKLNNGSHEDTWEVFATIISKTAERFLVDENPVSAHKKQELYNQLDALIKVLRTPPCHARSNWLSKMRNEINYQHKHGVWYPHEKSKNFREKVFGNLSLWTKSPGIIINNKTHFLDGYSQACTYVISLARDLIYDMMNRNPENNSFLKSNAIKALKQAEKVRGDN